MFRLVETLAAEGLPVATTWRVLRVSRSGFTDWANRPPSPRAVLDAELRATIVTIHQQSRASYGAPRVHAELRLGLGVRCGRKRVARLMRQAGTAGISHRKKTSRTRRLPAPHEDLVKRRFVADRPNQIWATDITEHPTAWIPAVVGRVYCAAVLDMLSRRIVGWAIADHIRSELVVDALKMD